MNHQDVKRKLTAILSADVEGYSRLMSTDEVGTIRTLTAYRDTMTNLILLHRGRVVDAPGDNLLAEFVSVVDAVQCAVEIQRELAELNQDLPKEKRMLYRIGVNLGEVVEEKERIYGDGVNIAARLESLCNGGGVCISGAAFENVENKLDLEFEDLGEHEVKNIAKPVRVYRVLSYPGAAAHRVIEAKKAVGKKWRMIAFAIPAALLMVIAAGITWNFYLHPSGSKIEVASEKEMAFPLPDKPSIAVLPFDNMSDDPEQEYFSDGITEDIITALSKVPELFVIARNSSFTYKGKSVKVQQISRELGVKYVLEGSVRKAGNRVRITAQLIDATTGHHLWAERYDRELTNIFALQDEITLKIITAMQVKLTEGEHGILSAKGTDNLEAYLKVLQGREYIIGGTREKNILAKQVFEVAVRLDPKYAAAYAGLSRTYLLEWVTHWSHEPRSLERALELVQKAISLDDTFSDAYETLGWIYLWKKQHAKAIAALNKTISLNPNDADGYATLGGILNFAGRPAEAIGLVEKAMRLNPHYSIWYLIYTGHSYFLTGEYDKAIVVYKKALTHNPDFLPPHIELAAIYSILGREAEARAEAKEVLRLSPDFALEGRRQRFPYKDPAVLERNIAALRNAGLK